MSCLPSGIPEKDNIPDGLKLVQTEDLTLILHESRTIYRQIFTDGRPLPKNPQPTWMGYSIGHWDKDTFVVETIGQNGKTWLDMRGLPGTEALRVTERFSRPKIGHMDIEVTIDDPKAYTKPWTVKLAWRLNRIPISSRASAKRTTGIRRIWLENDLARESLQMTAAISCESEWCRSWSGKNIPARLR